MRTSNRIVLLLLAGVLLMAGCRKRPDGILDKKEMASLTADMELANAYAMLPGSTGNDSARKVLRQSVLAAHNIDNDTYEANLDWYARHMDKYMEVLAEAEKQIDKHGEKLMPNTEIADDEVSGTSLWPYEPIMLLSDKAPVTYLDFSVEPDDFQPGESVEWKMKLSKQAAAYVVLAVDYTDGSTAWVQRDMMSSRDVEIKLYSDTLLKVNRVYGRLTLHSREALPLFADSISLMRHPRNPEEDGRYNSQGFFRFPDSKK